MDINLFTALARQEFIKGLQAVPVEKLPVDAFTTWIPSEARIETYEWMTPSPGISEYVGRRRAAKLDHAKLFVENKEFDGMISIPTRDIEDDKIGGYPIRFNELGVKASRFPERWIYQKLANGENVANIDGTNHFASTHNWGTGNSTLPSPFTGGLNLLTYTSANTSDGVTAKAVFLVHNSGSGPVKPVLYQMRKPPKVNTDAGTPQSSKAKQAEYWVDLEAEALLGYWWDAVLVKFVNTPNLTDIFTVIDQVIKQLLSFQLPAALPSDPPMYTHQSLDLTSQIGYVLVSPSLAMLFKHALNEERIGVSVAGSTAGITNNIFYRSFSLQSSGYII